MTYQVIARKYRPKRFSEVVGQEAIVKTILNALTMKRVGHAYLFSGSRGTGKTTIARLFAKALNCKNPEKNGEPCNECASCKEISLGQSLDCLEIDGASHRGIEDVRKIGEMSLYAPHGGHYKIYLIDEVHMLTKEAFNALLKLLEEPPEKVKFFFATTEIHKLPPTILSRCQRFQLMRISLEKIEEKLKSIADELNVEIDKGALNLLAKLSEGSLRDAEVLLDELIAAFDKKITTEAVTTLFGLLSIDRFFDLDEAARKQDYVTALNIAGAIYEAGRNAEYFIEELTHHFRTHLLTKKGIKSDDARYERAIYSLENCLDIIELLVKAANEIKQVFSEKIYLEQLLIKIVRMVNKPSLEAIVERLMALEGRLETKLEAAQKAPEIKQVSIAQETFEQKRDASHDKMSSKTLTNFCNQTQLTSPKEQGTLEQAIEPKRDASHDKMSAKMPTNFCNQTQQVPPKEQGTFEQVVEPKCDASHDKMSSKTLTNFCNQTQLTPPKEQGTLEQATEPKRDASHDKMPMNFCNQTQLAPPKELGTIEQAIEPKRDAFHDKMSAKMSENVCDQTLVAKGDALTIKEKSRFDTVMRFAAKELGGSLKKE